MLVLAGRNNPRLIRLARQVVNSYVAIVESNNNQVSIAPAYVNGHHPGLQIVGEFRIGGVCEAVEDDRPTRLSQEVDYKCQR